MSHDSPQILSNSKSKERGSVRQPVSCEPCRKRKIKCSRDSQPCQTCLRRRVASDQCVYKGSREESPLQISNSTHQQLVDRIGNLERLLKHHTGSEIPIANGESSSILSPLIESYQHLQSLPNSFTSELNLETSNPTEHTDRLGVLTSTGNGNVRYEPRASQWTSVLTNTGLSVDTPLLDDGNDTDLSSGFPFTSSSVPSKDELLSILPPIQHCDYLKDSYFKVFSPVCNT